MLEGVQYLHENGVAHSAIKPSNVLVVGDEDGLNEVIKLSDFGKERPRKNVKVNGAIESTKALWYAPPETLVGRSSSKDEASFEKAKR